VVFFRADTLVGDEYLASLGGLGPQSEATYLVTGVMYSRYTCSCWLSRNHGLDRREPDLYGATEPRAGRVCMMLLVISILFMWTQTENPFLYFQF